MESNFHVKILHGLHSCWKVREMMTPLGPCHGLVMLNYDDNNFFLLCSHKFLQCTPSLLILQALICSCTHQHFHGIATTKMNCHMQGCISTKNIKLVNNFKHIICSNIIVVVWIYKVVKKYHGGDGQQKFVSFRP